jgi:hypothetical protein
MGATSSDDPAMNAMVFVKQPLRELTEQSD